MSLIRFDPILYPVLCAKENIWIQSGQHVNCVKIHNVFSFEYIFIKFLKELL
jgi:hypothetical protein